MKEGDHPRMKQLVQRAQRGDAEAFVQLMEINKQAVYQVVRGYFNQPMDTEDILSETVLTCWEQLPRLRKPEFFKTWMIRIAINKCNDLLRQRKKVVPLEDLPEPVTTMEEGLPELLDRLDRSTRVILILHYAQGYTTREIAKMLEMPHGTVTSKLKRGRDKLAKQMEEESV